MIRRLRHDPTWWFSLQIPFTRPGRVLVGPRDSGVHRHVPADPPGRISQALQRGHDLAPCAVSLPPTKQRIHRRPGPVLDRYVTPGRAHPHPPAHPVNQLPLGPQRRPTRSLRGGQQRLQHRPLRVRQVNRPVTAVVSTRSPVVSGSSWSMNRYRRTRSSSTTDTPQPASPSCPDLLCG